MTEAVLESASPGVHAHHWRITEPNGPLSAGYCKRCGARREFRNWLESLEPLSDWDSHRATGPEPGLAASA